ncbi:YggS family pyridoxal phosphate-dependent enzyme [Litoribrevibacter euphylliae]|uniref:Pyridoxal phosphate homeostasis protein n=1 Tax=Litoribrevibacter euphylliae TaxID=1834034 RepID=A0ABV7HDR9_9GAMM
MTEMTQLAERFQTITSDIAQHPKPLGQSVDLLAVSKTRSGEEILEVHQLGQRAFGENYIQEAVDKIQQLKDYAIEWHFIGPLQSNKSRLAAENFAWVHTIDRLKIAKRLNEQRPEAMPPLNVCIQVNIDSEPTKSGFLADQVIEAALEVSTYPHLTLRGLMAIPQATEDKDQQLQSFTRMKTLFDQVKLTLKESNIDDQKFDTLSMGMSGDMEAAIQCGATIVRIGTAIFGPRPAKHQ